MLINYINHILEISKNNNKIVLLLWIILTIKLIYYFILIYLILSILSFLIIILRIFKKKNLLIFPNGNMIDNLIFKITIGLKIKKFYKDLVVFLVFTYLILLITGVSLKSIEFSIVIFNIIKSKKIKNFWKEIWDKIFKINLKENIEYDFLNINIKVVIFSENHLFKFRNTLILLNKDGFMVPLNLYNFFYFIKNIKAISIKKKIINIFLEDFKDFKDFKDYELYDLLWTLKILLNNYNYIDYYKYYDIEYVYEDLDNEEKYKIKNIFIETKENTKITLLYEKDDILLVFLILQYFIYNVDLENNFYFNNGNVKLLFNDKEINLLNMIDDITNNNSITIKYTESVTSKVTCNFFKK